MEHKKMADYAYHYGLKVRIYPQPATERDDSTQCGCGTLRLQ